MAEPMDKPREADMISSATPPAAEPGQINTTVAEILAGHAASRGEAVAVEDRRGHLTYGELAQLAARLAELIDDSVQDKGPIGILLPASSAYVAAIVGLLARGIAYVPLDESFPATRNGDIAGGAGLTAIIVDDSTADAASRIAPGLPQIRMPTKSEQAARAWTITGKPDDVAVIFYTSGSTGRPKGVYQSQRNILYEVLRHCWRAGLGHDDRIALIYSPSVSGSTRDIYGSLVAGARLCVIDVKREGLGETVRALADWRISVLHSIPGLYRGMFASQSEASERLTRSVRLVHLISDRVLLSDIALYQRRFPRDCRLCIDLATTETYSYASWYLDHDTVITRPLAPVGYPRPDMVLQLLGDDGEPVKAGELGEIVVSSRSLSLGYWRDEALTHTRFFPSRALDGATDFRTGDLGRMLPDGLLEFVGRKDRQVKMRGNTVHLAEVEAVLSACPGVAEVGAVARGQAPDVKLMVYCAAPAGETVDPATVSKWAALQLAPYMQPSQIIVLDALPRLPSGKPDMVGLARLDAERSQASSLEATTSRAIPVSAAMRAVFEGWETYLEPGAFDRDVAFDDAGGDSLKGLNLILFLEDHLKRRLPADILDMKTRPSALIQRLTAAPSDIDADDDGDQPKPVLLFFSGLYGADVSGTAFTRQLETRFSVVFVDYRWGGDELAGRFSADALFDAVRDIVRPLAADRRIWVLGYSYGGKIAAEAARRLLADGRAVEFVGVVDGMPDDRFLKRYRNRSDRALLVERLAQGAKEDGDPLRYVANATARRLGSWLAAQGRYRAFGWFLGVLASPYLAEANVRVRRGVIGNVRVKALAAMPLGPINARLWLWLSKDDRRGAGLAETLGWETFFNAIEVASINATHLDLLKGASADELARSLIQLERTIAED